GGRVDQRSVAGLPLLVAAAVAVPQLHEGAVGGACAGDVQALAVDLHGPVGRDGPLLVRVAGLAVPHLDLVAVGGAAGAVVNALGAVQARRDRPGRAAASRPVARGDELGLDRVLRGVGRVAVGDGSLEELT